MARQLVHGHVGKELLKVTVPLLTSSEIKSHYGRLGWRGSSRSRKVSTAAASVKGNSNNEIRSIGGIDGGEVARRGEVGSRPAPSLLLQIVSA